MQPYQPHLNFNWRSNLARTTASCIQSSHDRGLHTYYVEGEPAPIVAQGDSCTCLQRIQYFMVLVAIEILCEP